MTLKLALVAVPMALLMSARAYRKQSLSRSGALAAVLTGSVAMTSSVRLGVVLILFFLSSSKLTRVGAKRKAELEGRNYAGPGGNRTAVQVLANSGSATLLALAYLLLRERQRVGNTAGAIGSSVERVSWWAEPTESRLSFFGPSRITSLVQLAYVCHYACCNADSWASELGVLAPSPPRLITTLRTVRTGTNGGVSPLGLGASLCGGLLIGSAFFALGRLLCAPAELSAADGEWVVLVAAPLSGVVGSAVDSLLGALFQFSGYCSERKCVVEAPGPTVVRICGRPLLNNHAVNFVSALLTAAGATAIVAALTGGSGHPGSPA